MKNWVKLYYFGLPFILYFHCHLVSADIVLSVPKEIERIQKKADNEAVGISKKAHAEMYLMRQDTNQMIKDLRQQEKDANVVIEQTQKDLQFELREAENLRLEAEKNALENLRIAKQEAERLRQEAKKNKAESLKEIIQEKMNSVGNKERVLRRLDTMERRIVRQEEQAEKNAKRLEERAERQAAREIEQAQRRKDSTIRSVMRNSSMRIQRAENAKVRANIWVKKTVDRSLRNIDRHVKMMNKEIERSSKRAYALKLILLFAEDQIDKALQYGVKGSYEMHDINFNSLFLGNSEITLATMKLSNGYDLIFANLTGFTHRVTISGKDVNNSSYYHAKQYTILDKKIFYAEKYYNLTSKNLNITTSESPYLIESSQPLKSFPYSTSSVSLGKALNFQLTTFNNGRESILLNMGRSTVTISKMTNFEGKVIFYCDKEIIDLDNKRYLTELQYDPTYASFRLVKNTTVGLK